MVTNNNKDKIFIGKKIDFRDYSTATTTTKEMETKRNRFLIKA